MKFSQSLFAASVVTAFPHDILNVEPGLAARRANVIEPVPTLEERQSPNSIDTLIKNKGKLYFGAATDKAHLLVDKNAAIIKANLGQVTPEYSMKWASIEPTQGNFAWGDADYLVDFAQTNSKSIRGHTLIWYNALPDWVNSITDKATLQSVMETHISTVVGRYKGKIRSWDVVNEIFNDNGTFRSSVFYNVLGEDFVKIAFNAAHAADPAAKLYINDYNLDNAGWAQIPNMVSYVNKWISQGIPIDGIGSQSHLYAGMGVNVPAALKLLATASVSEIAITELDIGPDSPTLDYTQVVQGCLDEPKCVGITVWGISDKDSWRTDNPLLYDANFNPKPAYNSIVTLLS